MMMKTFFKQLCLVLMLLAGSAAYADGPYYVSNCDSGADPQCRNGDDAKNDGLSPDKPFQTFAKIQSLINTVPNPGGRVIRLAKGAKWTTALPLWISSCTRCTAAAPLVIEGYTPPLGGARTRWEIETSADINALKFEDGGDSNSDQGYIVRNGHVHPSSTVNSSQAGVYFFNDADDIIIEDMEIDRYRFGLYMAGSNALSAGDSGNGMVDRISVRNNFIHDNGYMGILGSCNYCVIENNDIVNNGGGAAADDLSGNHNIYISAAGATRLDVGLRIIGNRLSRSTVCSASSPRGKPTSAYPAGPTCADLGKLNKCDGSALVVHGRHKNLVIENNTIDETPGATAGCYGIQVDSAYKDEGEYFRDAVIRSNKVINVGGNGISVGSCPYCIIESNEVIWTGGSDTHLGIVVPDGTIQDGPVFDDHDTNMLIRNNTVYVGGSSAYNAGIVVNTPGSNLGQRVVSNLVFFPAGTVAGVSCYRMNSTSANFAVWDYNLCYSAGALPLVNQSLHRDMAAWNTAGFDQHGLFGRDPQIDTPTPNNGYSVAVGPNNNQSPTINTGHPSLSKRVGIRGRVNPYLNFIGANPFGSLAIAPAAPRLN